MMELQTMAKDSLHGAPKASLLLPDRQRVHWHRMCRLQAVQGQRLYRFSSASAQSIVRAIVDMMMAPPVPPVPIVVFLWLYKATALLL